LIKRLDAAAVLWEPQTAQHCGASIAEPAQYEARVIGWFASHQGSTLALAAR
jgi:hypothetical protein